MNQNQASELIFDIIKDSMENEKSYKYKINSDFDKSINFQIPTDNKKILKSLMGEGDNVRAVDYLHQSNIIPYNVVKQINRSLTNFDLNPNEICGPIVIQTTTGR